jgi:RecA/RadA recombinase
LVLTWLAPYSEEPDTIEDTLLWVQDFLHSLPDAEPDSPPHFVGWDSLAASQSADEFMKGIEAKDQVGGKAKLMSKAMRIIPRLAVKKKAHFLVVNQTRANIGVMFGPNKTTPGGAGLKFASTLRLSLWGGEVKKDGDQPVGKIVNFKATKNQVSIPGREMGIYLDFEKGFGNLRSTIVYAKSVGCIAKAAKFNEDTLHAARKALGWL